MKYRIVLTIALVALGFTGAASAHGGDNTLIHGCVEQQYPGYSGSGSECPTVLYHAVPVFRRLNRFKGQPANRGQGVVPTP